MVPEMPGRFILARLDCSVRRGHRWEKKLQRSSVIKFSSPDLTANDASNVADPADDVKRDPKIRFGVARKAGRTWRDLRGGNGVLWQ